MFKNLISLYFDTWASEYEADVDSYGYSVHTALFEAVSPYLDSLGDDPAILDCGIGTGLCSGLLQEAGYDDITGVDISRKMLALCRRKGIGRRLFRSSVMKLDRLPLETGHFDVILAGGLMEFIADPAGFFKTLAPYLSPDGIIACTHETLDAADIYRSGLFAGVIEKTPDKIVLRRKGSVFGLPYFYKKYLYDPSYIRTVAGRAGLVVREHREFEAYRWGDEKRIRYQLLVLERAS